MINDYGLSLSIAACAEAMRKLGLKPTVWDTFAKIANLEKIGPSTCAPILLLRTNGLFFEPVRWGRYDAGAKETVFFSPAEGRNFGYRCIIPASHFDTEFDDGSGPRRVRFSSADGGLLYLGGVWRPANSLGQDSFTIMLCNAGPDVTPFSAHQPVVVDPKFCSIFIDQTKDVRQLQRAGSAGILRGEVLEQLSASNAAIGNQFGMAKPDPHLYFLDGQAGPSLFTAPKRSFS